MVKFVSVRGSARAAAIAMLAGLAPAVPALAQADMDMPEAGPPPGYECAGEPVTGSGPGFSSSREASEEAAQAAWLEKAKAIFPEATWETALDADISCAVQGLYSKCFAQAIPCHPKAGEDASAPDDSGAADAPDEDGESEDTPDGEAE